MNKVSIEALRLRIQRLEGLKENVGPLALTEEFALEAFKMLLARLEDDAETQKAAEQMDCRHVWTYSMLSTTKTCGKCGAMVKL